jgi:eukaryotic-like serine/threonine-protein kinase
MTPGARLGPYELIAQIGAGGMGEVWKARDTRLGRDVAIKFSAQQFTDRFEREARAVAALNHPNVCTLHDIGPNYLVMELIEGATLEQRITQGPVPLEEALGYAGQIADALEAAHDRGIVHRDLKPANIKIRPDGSVRVLDFGLAKSAAEPAPFTADSPTMLSAVGMILGTAGYMSPEQARGQEADTRADIWAFGVVLYEMVTAQRLFAGKTVSDALAAVLTHEPEFQHAPVKVQRLLRACLQKDLKNRLHDIADWKLLLEENALTAVAPTRSRLAKGAPWGLAAMLLLAAVGLGGVAYRRSIEPHPDVLHVALLPPGNALFGGTAAGMLAVSPDGRRVAFAATTQGKSAIWLRDLDSDTARPLLGTDGGAAPFWSPDSRTVAFFEGNRLQRVDVAGGPVLTICTDTRGGPRGGTWARAAKKDVILFAVNTYGIFQVPAAGGTAAPLIKPNPAAGELNDEWPWFLPDGRHFLYSAQGNEYQGNVYVADLESSQRKRLVATPFNARFADSKLLFVREGNLLAQPFDTGKLQTTGDAVPVAEAVGNNQVLGAAFFSISQTGVLAYLSGTAGTRMQLTWLDRSGKQLGTPLPVSRISGWSAVSPDGSTVAIEMSDERAAGTDIWLYNLTRGAASRFTFGPARTTDPVWSPDGTHLAYLSTGDGVAHAFQKSLNGGKEEALGPALGDPPRATMPEDWSRDGRYLVERVIQSKTKDDIWIQPLFGDRKAFPYLEGDYNERNAGISPDGKWIVYSSEETGRMEIYAQTFPTPGGKVQISADGGERPRWSRDGKEIFFIAPDRKMMAVSVRSGATLEAGRPQALFDTHIATGFDNRFDIAKDGRFLIPVQQDSGNSQPINVIVNWPAILNKQQ